MKLVRLIVFLLAASVALPVTALAGGVYAAAAPIAIPDAGPAAPYPSVLVVPEGEGIIDDVNITLNCLGHTWPDDVDVVLEHVPSGTTALLLSDAGGPFGVEDVALTFDDEAAGPSPDEAPLVAGVYAPADYAPFGEPLPPPAPAPPYGPTLDVFDGIDASGMWNLWVFDDFAADAGDIADGWTLDLTGGPPFGPCTAAGTYTDPAPIEIPYEGGPAAPYPTAIDVPPGEGVVTDVNVTLNCYGHWWPDDVNAVLEHVPTGTTALLMSDAGGPGEMSVDDIGLTFDDEAAGLAPDGGPLATGSFGPADYAPFGEPLPPPAPAPPYGATLDVFDGIDASGMWNLWIFDEFPDLPGFGGDVEEGWTLDFTGGAPAGPCTIPAPANDDFADAGVIDELRTGGGVRAGTTVGASVEAGEPAPGWYLYIIPTKSVWYTFTPTVSNVYTFDTCSDPAYDTILAVYTGPSVDALTEVAANDNRAGCGDGTQSRLSFNGRAGTTYHIAVDGAWESVGTFTLSFSGRTQPRRIRPVTPPPPPPPPPPGPPPPPPPPGGLDGPPGDPANDHIPELTFAPPVEADFTEVDGVPLSRRTFLIVFEPTTTVAQANDLLVDIDATIIGGIHDAALLYVRLPDRSISETMTLFDSLQTDGRIAGAVMDAGGLEPQQLPPHNVDPGRWTWEVQNPPANGNWGLKLIRAPQLWNLDTFVRRNRTGTTVCAGVGEVGNPDRPGHPDVIWDAGTPNGPADNGAAGSADHITLVSGIIGATWNNNTGVESVDPWLNGLYARVVNGWGIVGSAGVTTAALLETIVGQVLPEGCVKAVNLSMGYHGNAADPGQTVMDGFGNMLNAATAAWAGTNRGDFFLVGSAGNGGAAQIARRNSATANAAARGLHDRFLAVESIDSAGASGATSDSGGSVSAPGECVRSTEASNGRNFDWAACASADAGGGDADRYATQSGTSLAAPHVTGLIAALWKLEPALTLANVRTLVSGADYTVATATAGRPGRIDAFAAAMGIDLIRGNKNLQRALADVDDGSYDGNQRVNRWTGAVDDTIGNAGSRRGDGRITMKDFRTFRDAYLQTHAAEFGAGGVPAVDLDGASKHFKKDLNFDGCVRGEGADPAHPVDVPARSDAQCTAGQVEETAYPRYDFNGDGRIGRFPAAARFKQDVDLGNCPDNGAFTVVAPPGCLRDVDVSLDNDLWNPTELGGYNEQVFPYPVDEDATGSGQEWEPPRFVLGNRDEASGSPPVLRTAPDYLQSYDLHLRINWDAFDPCIDMVVICPYTQIWGQAPVSFERRVVVPRGGQPPPIVTMPLWTGLGGVIWTAWDSSNPSCGQLSDMWEWTDIRFGQDRRYTVAPAF